MSSSQPAGQPKVRSLVLVALLCAASLVVLPTPVAASADGPRVVNYTWIDADNNGHSDGVELLWSKDIRDETVRPSDFQIRLGSVTIRATGFSTSTFASAVTAGDDDTRLTLYYPEFANYDGEGGLTITYLGPASDTNPEGIKSDTYPTGFPLGEAPSSAGDVFGSATAFEEIQPQLRSLLVKPGESRIYAVFTERVGRSTGAATSPAISDFFCPPAASTVPTVTAVEGTGPSRVWSLVLSRAITSDEIASAASTPTGTYGLCPGHAVRDIAGNPAQQPDLDPYTSGAQLARAGDLPYLLRIHASRGDPSIVAEFSAPVARIDGAAFTDTSMFAITPGSASAKVTGITIASTAAGSDRIVLASSGGVPNAADVLNLGTPTDTVFTTFDIVANSVFAWKSGASNYPLMPGPAGGSPSLAANKQPLMDGNVGSTTLPRVNGFVTRDLDEDGEIDAVEVTMNEDIKDPATISTLKDGWGLYFPRITGSTPVSEAFVVPSGATTGKVVDGATVLTADDNVFTLTFTELADFGSGTLPRLVHCDPRGSEVLASGPNPSGCPPFPIVDHSGNTMASGVTSPVYATTSFPFRPFLVPSTDGARPILQDARTIDTSTTANGNTNGYLLVFSEPIQDHTFDHTRWTATGPGGVSIPIVGKDTVTANDNQMRIVWDERGYDTGVVPDLTYTGGPAEDQFVKDLTGVLRLENINPGTPVCPAGYVIDLGTDRLCEKDGVGPFLISVEVTVGASGGVAVFSEDIPTATSGPFFVDHTDFAYRARNSVGAASIVDADVAGSDPRRVTLTFNTNIASADISGSPNDCIQLRPTLTDAASSPAFPPFDTAATAACRNFLVASDAPKLDSGAQPQTLDSNNDGYLDAIKLTFTKPIDDATLAGQDPTAFKYRFGAALNKSASGVVTGKGAAPTPGVCPLSGALEPNVASDNIIFVCFGVLEMAGVGPAPNTAQTPLVSFTRPAGSTLAATNTFPVGAFAIQPTIDGAKPVLMEALGNPGSSIVRLTFSEPVGKLGGGPLAASDLLYSNGNPGTAACPSGASNVATVSPYAVAPSAALLPLNITVTLNGKLTNADIGSDSGCSTFDSIRPNPSGVFELAAAGSKGAYLPPVPQVQIKDGLPPSLLEAGFVDGNGDGVVDAVRLNFTEFVDDDTLQGTGAKLSAWNVKYGSTLLKVTTVSTGWISAADDGASGVNVCSTKVPGTAPSVSVPLTPDGTFDPPPAGASWVDDQILFLCLDSTVPSSAGGTLELGTGIEGVITYAPTDTARGRDLGGNFIPSVTGLDILDKARPVVLNRQDANPVHVETTDRNGNGKVDAYRLTFSEPINDTTFKASEWSVAGRTVVTALDTVGVANTPAGVFGNDSRIWIAFNESAHPDTGLGSANYPAAPQLTYAESGSMRDKAGNRVRTLAAGACTLTQLGCAAETDGAGPVVVGAQATVGTNFAKIIFSEAVSFGPGRPGFPCGSSIRGADLQFLPGNAEGADGIVTVAHDLLPPQPPCGATNMTVGFDKALTTSDLARDRVGFIVGGQADSIREARGPGYLPLVNRYSWLNRLADGNPPPPITDLKVKNLSITSLGFNWTTPAQDDLATLELRLCKCSELPAANFTAATLLSGMPVPDPGKLQTATASALVNGEEYCAAIITIDVDGNPSAISNVVCAIAEGPDVTAPGSLTLRVVSTVSTQLTLGWTAPGEDGSTGTVDRYQVAAGTGLSTDALILQSLTTQTTFNPSPLAGPGAEQRVTISGLATGANLTFAVRACDKANNCGPWAKVDGRVGVLVGLDSTPPAGVLELTATQGTPPHDAVVLSWKAPGDNGTIGQVASYVVRVSKSAIGPGNAGEAATVTFEPAALAATGATQKATVTGLQGGTTYFFTVAARDEVPNVGIAAAVNFTTAADPNAVTADQLKAALEAINDCLEAEHLGDEGVEVSWCVPDIDGKQPAGIQIWRINATTGASELVATVRPTDPAWEDGSFVDAAGTEESQYKATVFYDETQSQGFVDPSGSPDGLPGYTDLAPTLAAAKLPLWVYIALGAAVLIILALILALILKGRKGPRAAADEPSFEPAPTEEPAPADAPADAPEGEWKEAEAAAPAEAAPTWKEEPVAPAAAPGAPPQPKPSATTHYITCPSCATDFRATGLRPLALQCPSCGARGVLR